MNIYVGNMAYGVTEDDLTQLFSEHGSVQSVTIIKDRETGNSKGFGFVEMDNQADGENAIKSIDGSAVKGRNVKVNQARSRNENSKPKRHSW